MLEQEIINLVRPYNCLYNIDVELPALFNELKTAESFLEIGTYKGATSAALALMYPSLKITTIDLPDTEQSKNNAQANSQCGVAIHTLNLENRIEQIRIDSKYLLPVMATRSFGLIFVDGDHSTDAVYRDLLTASILCYGKTIIAHDYTEPQDYANSNDRPYWTTNVYNGVQMFLNTNSVFKVRRLPGWLVALDRV